MIPDAMEAHPQSRTGAPCPKRHRRTAPRNAMSHAVPSKEGDATASMVGASLAKRQPGALEWQPPRPGSPFPLSPISRKRPCPARSAPTTSPLPTGAGSPRSRSHLSFEWIVDGQSVGMFLSRHATAAEGASAWQEGWAELSVRTGWIELE